MKFLIFIFALSFPFCTSMPSDDTLYKTLADFTAMSGVPTSSGSNAGNVSSWVEVSDTYRTVGMSKAAIVRQNTKTYSRAIFFSMLNPQPNGAGFAGMNVHPDPPIDVSGYSAISIHGRARGNVEMIKLTLRDAQLDSDGDYGNFKATFEVDLSEPELKEYVIPFSDIVFARRGIDDSNHRPIDLSSITQIGLQTFGGYYDDDIAQSGATAFEIDWIKAKLN